MAIELPDLDRLTLPELLALRALFDRVIPIVAAAERSGGGHDLSVSLEPDAASAILVISTEVQQ